METEETRTYKITLSNGTVFDDLVKNGDNYISKKEVSAASFDGACCPVIISDGEAEERHSDMALVHVLNPASGVWWFALRDLHSEELTQLKNRSDIEYLAMMCDVTL